MTPRLLLNIKQRDWLRLLLLVLAFFLFSLAAPQTMLIAIACAVSCVAANLVVGGVRGKPMQDAMPWLTGGLLAGMMWTNWSIILVAPLTFTLSRVVFDRQMPFQPVAIAVALAATLPTRAAIIYPNAFLTACLIALPALVLIALRIAPVMQALPALIIAMLATFWLPVSFTLPILPLWAVWMVADSRSGPILPASRLAFSLICGTIAVVLALRINAALALSLATIAACWLNPVLDRLFTMLERRRNMAATGP